MNFRPALALLASQLSLWCLPTSAEEVSRKIRIQGSDTMLQMNEAWAREFRSSQSLVTFQIIGGGSGLGMKALLAREVEIAASSRPLRDSERAQLTEQDGQPPVEIEVALDAVAVYVHDSNPVTWLRIRQVRDIFQGRITNWQEVGGKNLGIHRFSRNADSGTYEFFSQEVLDGGEFSSDTHLVGGTEAVRSAVSRNPRAIGYGGIGYAQGVRLVRIIDEESGEPVEPSNINVVTEMYPLSRPLYYVTRGPVSSPALNEYLRWVLSAKGQKMVAESHYYPLPKSRRRPPPSLNPNQP